MEGYLESAKFENFQSHVDTYLEFCDGVNFIIGVGNNGKSALIRGLDWCWTLRPRGNEFIHDDAETCAVTTTFRRGDRKLSVALHREKKKAHYVISKGRRSSNINASINPPREVTDLVNVQGINVQGQFSPYFLIFDSPGSVARYIREIAGLNEIDQLVKLVKSKITQKDLRLLSVRDDMDRTDLVIKDLQEFPFDTVDTLIVKLEDNQEKQKSLESRNERLQDLLEEIDSIQRSLVPGINRKVKLAKQIGEEGSTLEQSCIKLLGLISSIVGCDKIMKVDYGPVRNLSRDLLDTYAKVSTEYFDLDELLEELENVDEELTKAVRGIEKTKQTIGSLKENLTECPTCGTEITSEEQRKRILEAGV